MQRKIDVDKKLERSNADKVLRRFANNIKDLGFKRTKPTFFVREVDFLIEFIHIHKYTFDSTFRMHICLRVLNESRDFIALSGPTDRELQEGTNFRFGKDIESVEACAVRMAEFVHSHAELWFSTWHDRKLLLADGSPLYDDQKLALEEAIIGNFNINNVIASKAELKIA